ncbi:MAG: PmoA family protein [Maribacter sp.]|uniref:DUF6807 domain-containing protein n=1 Tax=Maribacter sp. TaxID=1897614 RepID=UPI003C796800
MDFEVVFNQPIAVSTPIFIPIGPDVDKNLVLVRKMEGSITKVPIQRFENKLFFMAEPSVNISEKPIYSLKSRFDSGLNNGNAYMVQKNGNLQMGIRGKPVLEYRYGMHYPPSGVDSIFRKSGYIHPLLTPKGDTLTRINPPDHFHHYGIWGPWTHTRIDTTRVDFWNLGDGQGTVLFKEFVDTTSGPVFSAFSAVQEHIDFKTEKEPQVALNENLKVTLWNLDQPDRYMFDYTTTFNSPLKNGILFEAYRYGGGIGMRFNERWKKDNCTVMTSEGESRIDADGTNARWVIISGESRTGKGTNGILFMSHPNNRMHPEPMRIWPEDANGGRGDMFFEFCPIRNVEWPIESNKDYGLTYRMVVFEGSISAEEAEDYWQGFANPPEVRTVFNSYRTK